MKTLSTMFNNIEQMKDSMTSPRWLVGFLYMHKDERETPNIDLGVLMEYFGFNRSHELFSTYYSKYPDAIGTPNHENITLFFEHLKDVGMTEKFSDPFAIIWTDKAESIYNQILDGTYPKDVNWDLDVPHHPYQGCDGYKT